MPFFLTGQGAYYTCEVYKWHPTPLFLPGKFQEQRAFRAAVHAAVKSQTRLRLAQRSTACVWNVC